MLWDTCFLFRLPTWWWVLSFTLLIPSSLPAYTSGGSNSQDDTCTFEGSHPQRKADTDAANKSSRLSTESDAQRRYQKIFIDMKIWRGKNEIIYEKVCNIFKWTNEQKSLRLGIGAFRFIIFSNSLYKHSLCLICVLKNR